MRVGEVVCSQAVLVGEPIQVRHRGISDDIGEVGVFLDDNEHVAKPHALTGRWRGIGCLSYATGQREDAGRKRKQSKLGDRQTNPCF